MTVALPSEPSELLPPAAPARPRPHLPAARRLHAEVDAAQPCGRVSPWTTSRRAGSARSSTTRVSGTRTGRPWASRSSCSAPARSTGSWPPPATSARSTTPRSCGSSSSTRCRTARSPRSSSATRTPTDVRWVQEEPANQGAWPYFGLELPEKLPDRLSRLHPRLPQADGRTRAGLVEGPRGRTEGDHRPGAGFGGELTELIRTFCAARSTACPNCRVCGRKWLEALLHSAVRSRDGGSSGDRSLWNSLRPGSSAA